MKKNLLTGLAILLPVALTLWILSFLINLLTAPFLGLVESFLPHTEGLTSHSLIIFASKILILLFLAALTLLIGFLGQHFLVRSFLQFSDYLLHRIPLVNKIYKGAQDIVKTLFSEDKTNFSQVVLVPFPRANTRSLGFLTKPDQTAYLEKNKVSIFVPGTPNPTMGFMLLFDRDQVTPVDMTVEEALKFIISCGVMSSPFKK